MTEKLYDDNSYLKSFEADVLNCEKNQDGTYSVVLNKTAFFPEEGGQCCDTGFLDGAEVLYVLCQNNGTIIHITDKAISGRIYGEIDFSKRFRNMQNHTGEHILSGLIFKNYGFENIGFHLGKSEITMDIGGILTAEDLQKIETEANAVVYSNIKVTAYYPDKESLKKLNYRSKKEIDGAVRIVNIAGVDNCACCAPHVSYTGEIGIIKILGSTKLRGGTRLSIKCGFEALNDYAERYTIAKKISSLLKSPQNSIDMATELIFNENKDLKFEISKLKRENALLKAEKKEYTSGNICIFEESASTDDLRFTANALKVKCGGICAVLSGNDTEGYSYCITGENVDLTLKIKEINNILNGTGGGSKNMIFGKLKATQKQIKSYFEER